MTAGAPRADEAHAADRVVASLRGRLDRAAVCGADEIWRFGAAGAVPRHVVQPADAAGVAGVVREAAAAGLAVVPAGNATHLDVGLPPRRYDLALSTRRLGRIVAHNAADMTVTAEAGVTLAALNAQLAVHGQWLPLDPARAEAMTLGGLIAADRNGPLRLTHGTVRDLLIGLQVVAADGAIVRGGGRVVKNVAGYDLPKLFVGSYGTLGVIVEATFKVRPRPPAEALFVWPQPSLAAAHAQALAVLGSPVFPALLEVVNEPAAESLGLECAAAVLIGCAGGLPHLAEQERRVAERSAGTARRCEAARATAVLKALREFSQPANEEGLVVRLSAVPAQLGPLLKRIEDEATARRAVAEIAVHAGSGVAWCQVLGAPDPTALALFAESMRVTARARGAWVILESLPAALRGRLDPWGFPDAAVPLMAKVKAALDPHGLFSPGRFVGGI